MSDEPPVKSNHSTVTIAFPFSAIKTGEPDPRVDELAQLVVDLAERVAKLAPGPETDELLERARTSLIARD